MLLERVRGHVDIAESRGLRVGEWRQKYNVLESRRVHQVEQCVTVHVLGDAKGSGQRV